MYNTFVSSASRIEFRTLDRAEEIWKRLWIEPLEPRLLLSAYFVAASGGNDANSGTSIDQPLATIQAAANRGSRAT